MIAVPGRFFWGPASRCSTLGKILERSDTLDGETCSEGKMLETIAGASPALGRTLQVLFTFFFLMFVSMKWTTFQETFSPTYKELGKVCYSAWCSIFLILFHGQDRIYYGLYSWKTAPNGNFSRERGFLRTCALPFGFTRTWNKLNQYILINISFDKITNQGLITRFSLPYDLVIFLNSRQITSNISYP